MVVIVCEGLDGSGKTSMIKYALDYCKDYSYLHGLWNNNFFSQHAARNPSTGNFLMAQLYLDWNVIRPELVAGKNIILDRWYYSVLSHNPPNQEDVVAEKIFKPFLSEPSVFILCTVGLEERLERLSKKRNHGHIANDTSKLLAREERLRKYFDEFSWDKYLIDTSGKKVEESGCELLSIMEKYVWKYAHYR